MAIARRTRTRHGASMRRTNALIHAFLCFVLIWQGATGALASGRMAAFEAVTAGALCRPSGGDQRRTEPQSLAEHALCAQHCGAVQAAAPPAAPRRPAAPVLYATIRYGAPTLDAPLPQPIFSPLARGPPIPF